jgi:hypothetical protein
MNGRKSNPIHQMPSGLAGGKNQLLLQALAEFYLFFLFDKSTNLVLLAFFPDSTYLLLQSLIRQFIPL